MDAASQLNEIIKSHTNWFDISRDPRTTWFMVITVREYIDCWDYCGLSYNPNIEILHILAALDKPWNWDVLSKNLHPASIVELPWLPWNWTIVTRYNATWNLIKKHPGLPWDYAEFSRTGKMTRKILIENMSLPWDFDHLSSGTLVNMTLLKTPGCSALPWNWTKLTKNCCIGVKTMLAHWKYPWDWKYLIEYDCIALFEVFNRPHVPWEWEWFKNNALGRAFTREHFYEKLDESRKGKLNI